MLLVEAIILGVAAIWFIPDAFGLALLVAAAGLIWISRQKLSWLLAGVFVAAGLYWSSLDNTGCSAWWRSRIIFDKLAGKNPYVASDQLWGSVFAPCFLVDESTVGKSIQKLEEKSVDGQIWERYRTPLGNFWIEGPGRKTLEWLTWELNFQSDYESKLVALRPGDTVIDCGAHVGVFSKYALQRGASRVIAIEPEPVTIAMLEANLADEIAAGKVIVVKAGVWNRRENLALWHSRDSAAANSFVHRDEHYDVKTEGLPLLPLDDIVQGLRLDRVDFIKMDIEGAEREALAGAQQTMRRFQPRMAICTYHLPDDPAVIPSLAQKALPSYRIHAKDFEPRFGKLSPKVLFFQ